jgi:hypothetical protein
MLIIPAPSGCDLAGGTAALASLLAQGPAAGLDIEDIGTGGQG